MLHFSVHNIVLVCKLSYTSATVASVLLKGRECAPTSMRFARWRIVPHLYLSLRFR